MNEPMKRGRGRPRKEPIALDEGEGVAIEQAPRPTVRAKKRDTLRKRLIGKKRFATGSTNPFDINPEIIPEGVSLEWKRWSLNGQTNTSLTGDMYISKMKQQGWEVMTADEFPEIMPDTANSTDPILVEGLLLMGRPAELTDAAQDELKKEAESRVKDRMRAIGSSSDGHAPLTGRIDTEIGIPVPKD